MNRGDDIPDLLCRLYQAVYRDFGVRAASVKILLLENEPPIRLPIPRRAKTQRYDGGEPGGKPS